MRRRYFWLLVGEFALLIVAVGFYLCRPPVQVGMSRAEVESVLSRGPLARPTLTGSYEFPVTYKGRTYSPQECGWYERAYGFGASDTFFVWYDKDGTVVTWVKLEHRPDPPDWSDRPYWLNRVLQSVGW